MTFETNKDVLDWYERQPRALTREFIDEIPWRDVKNYPLDRRFVPVLMYMRDIEILTEMYHEELKRREKTRLSLNLWSAGASRKSRTEN